jgi:hypothetical protein
VIEGEKLLNAPKTRMPGAEHVFGDRKVIVYDTNIENTIMVSQN